MMMADDEQPDTPVDADEAAAPGEEPTDLAASAKDGPSEAQTGPQDPAAEGEAQETTATPSGGDEPALAAEAPEPEPAEEAKEPQPAEEAKEPQPAEEAKEPQLTEQASEPQATEQASEPQATEQASEPLAEQAQEPEAAEEAQEPSPRVKPAVPGAHLEVDIVPEGVDPLGRGEQYEDPYAVEDDETALVEEGEEDGEEVLTEPIATAAIDLAADARYRATGKRKTAIARVTLRPGSGTYLINGRTLEEHFPRSTLQRNIRQPLETVGYQDRMDVVARLHGGGISAQAGALRHGVSRALLEADPNLRGELKRRGFLTRDSRAKERKKAGLKKARKRPQFSKR
jgi:small subunit ribosomal protein S9